MAKPPICLLHGALGSSAQLEALASELESEFEPLIHAFPGHGARKGFGAWTLSSLAQDFLQARREPIFAFGYSMGGYVDLMAEAQRPGFLLGLLTLGTKFDWSPEATEREIKKLDPGFLSAKASDFVESLKRLHGSDRWMPLLAETADMMRELSEGGTLSEVELKKISTRVCLGWASNDRMVSRAETEAVHALIARSTFELFEGAHALESVEVSALAAAIKREFLKA